ncbi:MULTISPECIES: head maturation protease, ClpP-related [unclassified Streptomyces]|uniref:head maturation protease, ClpP-related n=1 Tax=unclassified Streptomyces TaxID=2593676 RepID=UPI00068C52D5|nr:MULTISPECIES: head maturation protease, ClpP-related [unclassified Streptomyces]
MNITLPGKAASFQASQREQAAKQRQALGIEARSWYRITNAASDTEAEVMLYDEVGGWFGATADEFIADLRGITAPNLRVRVNSPGGSVFEGIAIANALRSHPAQVTVQVDGIAASIASVIAMAGDRIEMAPNTMLMIHDASGVCMGNAADMEEMAELLDLISDNIADAYATRAGGTRDEWRARMKAETWYLPEDAVTAGLADEAVQAPKSGTAADPDEGDEPDMGRAFDLAAYGYHGPRATEQSKAEDSKPEPQLVISIADLLDEDTVTKLRAAVRERGAETAAEERGGAVTQPAEDTAAELAVEYEGEHGPELVALDDTALAPAAPEPEAPAAEPENEWTAMVAHLTQDEPDTWSVLVSNLTTTASSSAATEA